MKANEQHVHASQRSKNNKNSNINDRISESFKKLTNNDKLNRINGAVNLLQHLKTIKLDENQVCVIIWRNSTGTIFRLEHIQQKTYASNVILGGKSTKYSSISPRPRSINIGLSNRFLCYVGRIPFNGAR